MSIKDTLDQIINRHESGKFFILEIAGNFIRGTNLSVSDNNIQINEIIYEPKEENSLEEILETIPFPANAKVIILGGAQNTITYPAWVSVTRNDVKKEIDEGELENIISQAVWKFLNHYQTKAVQKLEVTEADVILANIRVLGVRINRHKVLNPIGFKANTIEFLLEQTFINRDLYRLIESKLGPKSEIVFVSQIGIIESLAIVQTFGSDAKANLLRLLPGKSLVLDINTKARFQDDITDPIITLKGASDFNSQNLFKGIIKSFDIEPEPASEIYDAYIEGRTSSKMGSLLKDLIKKEWISFTKAIKEHLKPKRDNFILSDYSVSQDCLVENPLFKSVDIKNIVAQSGFEYDKVDTSVTTALSGFIGYQYSNHEDGLNKLAERRAKWLIP